MQIISRFGFHTNIAVISGHPRFDRKAARIMEAIKSKSKNPVKFIGVIGDEYKDLMSEVYASSSVLKHQQIVINRNYRQEIQDSILNPYRTITHIKNYQLIHALRGKHFFEAINNSSTPAIITVGNYSLVTRIGQEINQQCDKDGSVKPLRIAFDNSITHRTVGNEEFVDFMYYNLPRIPDNYMKYTFPSFCIGYEGLFKAFQYLQKFRVQSDNDSFRMKEFSYEVAELIKKARSEYRTSKEISQDDYITILAPGNTAKQIKFSFKCFRNAINNFSNRSNIQNVDSKYFKFSIMIPKDESLASQIRSQASSLPSKYEYDFIQEKDKYAAMCSADFALLHSGQVTVQAAACQLPATVISSMSNYKAYITYLYNGHESPLNVSTNYEGYQDLLGSLTAIGQKMGTLMQDHFERPKLRFYYVKLYREQIQKMLMMMGRNPQFRVSQTGLECAAQDILQKIETFEQFKATNKKLRFYDRKELLGLSP